LMVSKSQPHKPLIWSEENNTFILTHSTIPIQIWVQQRRQTGISEGRSHNDGFISEFLVIIVDFRYRLHSGVFEHFEFLLIGIRDIPVLGAKT
jgi:hypothetical protein